MTFIVDGTAGLTYPNSTVQASAGVVLQVVNATFSASFSTASSTFVTTGYAVTITPKFSTSKIIILTAGGMVATAGTGNQPVFTIYRGAVNIGDSSVGLCEYLNASGGSLQSPLFVSTIDSPATTSATTYTIYQRQKSGTSYINQDSCITNLIAMEIAG